MLATLVREEPFFLRGLSSGHHLLVMGEPHLGGPGSLRMGKVVVVVGRRRSSSVVVAMTDTPQSMPMVLSTRGSGSRAAMTTKEQNQSAPTASR